MSEEYLKLPVGYYTYWGHDLYLSKSCDVIKHVTIRFAIRYFLSVVL